MDAIKSDLIAYLVAQRNEAVLALDFGTAWYFQGWIGHIRSSASNHELRAYYLEFRLAHPLNQSVSSAQLSLF